MQDEPTPLPPVDQPINTSPPVTSDVTMVPGPDPSVVKAKWYWIKDSKGYGSVTVTMLFVSFWVTTLAYVTSIVDHVGPIAFRQFDVGACAAYFSPILCLYFSRKYTEAKFAPLQK